jgi:hypothetical protein
MHARQPAAVGINGQFPSRSNRATGYELSTLPLCAESHVFEKQNGVDRERVVELDDIDVRRSDASLCECAPGRADGTRHRQVGHGCYFPMGGFRSGSEQVSRPLAMIGSLIRSHHHDGCGAIRYQATIPGTEGIANHARGHIRL